MDIVEAYPEWFEGHKGQLRLMDVAYYVWAGEILTLEEFPYYMKPFKVKRIPNPLPKLTAEGKAALQEHRVQKLREELEVLKPEDFA